MEELGSPNIVYSSKAAHWQIDIHRPDGVSDPLQYVVFLTGLASQPFLRMRYMELDLFRSFTTSVEHVRQRLPIVATSKNHDEIPQYPNCCRMTAALASAFRVDLYLSRHGSRVEKGLAVYDTDDDNAPMLIAADEEVDQLFADCVAALRSVGVEPESPPKQSPNSFH